MIGNTFFFGWEVTLIIFLQTYFIQLVPIIDPFSYLGDQPILILIFGLLYWCWDKKAGKTLGLMLGLGFVINPMIKNIALRRRPYFDIKEIKCLKAVESSYPVYDVLGQGFSLPSLHATNTMIIFSFLANYIREKWMYILAILIILIVGFGRIFLGVHYPTDVIIGWLVGIGVIAIVYILQLKIKNQKLVYLIIFLIGLLGLTYCRSIDYFRSLGVLIGIICGFLFEEKYVNFKNTRNYKRIIIRLISGLGLLAIVLVALKLVFPSGTDNIALIAILVRYAITLFIFLGLYPLLFNKFDKYFKEDNIKEDNI